MHEECAWIIFLACFDVLCNATWTQCCSVLHMQHASTFTMLCVLSFWSLHRLWSVLPACCLVWQLWCCCRNYECLLYLQLFLYCCTLFLCSLLSMMTAVDLLNEFLVLDFCCLFVAVKTIKDACLCTVSFIIKMVSLFLVFINLFLMLFSSLMVMLLLYDKVCCICYTVDISFMVDISLHLLESVCWSLW